MVMSFNHAVELFNQKNFQGSLNILLKLKKNNKNDLNLNIYISFNLMFLKKYAEALEYLLQIEKSNDQIPQLHFNMGICYEKLHNHKLAIASYLKTIKFNPKYLNAYLNLEKIYLNNGDVEEALSLLLKANQRLPNEESINLNISNIYKDLGKIDLSIVYCKKILEKNSNNIFALNNLAQNYIELDQYEEALMVLQKAEKINEKFLLTLHNMALVYKYLNHLDVSIKYLNQCLRLDPTSPNAKFMLSEILLKKNQFREGWINYESRWDKTDRRPKKIKTLQPLWSPQLGYKRIFIWGEQGLGDQILFSTIIKDIVNKFQKIFLAVDIRLVNLLQSYFPSITVVDISKKLDERLYDYHLPIASLGQYFRNHINLFSNANSLDTNKKKILNKKFKCALSYKSFNSQSGKNRSIDLDSLSEILELEHIEFFDIQYSQSNEIQHPRLFKIDSLDTTNDIKGIYNFIKSCDLVISICNTNAHIAGLTGIPTYVLSPMGKGDFWHWSNTVNSSSLWYPNITVITQETFGSWQQAIKKLEKTIKEDFVLKI